MNSKMAMEPAKVVYGKRKTIVETVFGQIKNSGFRSFSVRGKEKNAGEFSMVCAAQNFKKNCQGHCYGINPSSIWKFRYKPCNIDKNTLD
jgi:hypothetical protein